MKNPINPSSGGFSLIITISMMVLLSLLAVGLLGLATISLRSSSRLDALNEARANARLGLALAIGQLQQELGPDQRISAAAAILDQDPASESVQGLARSEQFVGVWDSWSLRAGETSGNPRAPNYALQKSGRFRTWLASSTDDTALRDPNWVAAKGSGESAPLFREARDGFRMDAELLPLETGAVAWATIQENTKARILPGGYHGGDWTGNDAVLAPARTGFELSDGLASADGKSAPALTARLVSLSQVGLSEIADANYDGARVSSNYSVQARGVLTDVVDGGLRKDLTTAFELPDSSFSQPRMGDRANPFIDPSDPRFKGERALFEPGPGFAPEVKVTDAYGAASVEHPFKLSHLPTFTSLRSHYRSWRHLYETGNGLTAWNRPRSGAAWPDGAGESMAGIMPVVDRVLMFLQASTSRDGTVNLLITPVVTLWNPYGVALDCEGFAVYPWLDFPLNITWTGQGGTGNEPNKQTWLSLFLGSGDTGEGRTKQPYFILRLTSDGSDSTRQPIRFEPGEVKVFALTSPTPRLFNRLGRESDRTWGMKPVDGLDDLVTEGGLVVPMNTGMQANSSYNYKLRQGARLKARLEYTKNLHKYYLVMEDAGRFKGREPQVITNVQVDSGASQSEQVPDSPWMYYEDLVAEPIPLGVLETFHRTARGDAGTGRVADLAYTTNPHQSDATSLLTGSLTKFKSAPHFNATLRGISDIVGSGLEVTLDGRRSYYGESNSVSTGRDHLVFSEVPRSPLVSLGSLQHADFSNSVYAPMRQFGNSWASPYVRLDQLRTLLRGAKPRGVDFYDFSYLSNEALWDSCFFSGLAPEFAPGGSGGGRSAWKDDQVTIRLEAAEVAKAFFSDPEKGHGRVARYRPWDGRLPTDEVVGRVTGDEAALLMAAHLMVDGAFNVNSTRVEAWSALLAAARGVEFETLDPTGAASQAGSKGRTSFPRLHHPFGTDGEAWLGYRSLSDQQIRKLAEEIVVEVKRRGPFQSLAEFVNRRIEDSDLGRTGAVQSAIDRSGVNRSYVFDTFDRSGYLYGSNLATPQTGVGVPGYLTQADLLQPMAPCLTVRSDCFVVRALGESRDADGSLRARAVCEAVVQRYPELVDSRQDAATSPESWNEINLTFGRRFEVVAFRWMSPDELQ